MVLLGAGFTVMSRGTVGFIIGSICVVVALVWKLWATRTAARMMEEKNPDREDPALPPEI